MKKYKVYKHKIISIMEPGNWIARFDGSKEYVPLVAWALIEDNEGNTQIKGMVSAEYQQILPCDCFDQFLCYVPTVNPTIEQET